MSQKNNKIKSAIREWVESILIALVLAIFIRTYFFQPFKIPSGSMRMTLIEGDHLFVNKLRYGPIFLPELHAPEFLRKWIGPDFDINWPDFLHPLAKVRLPGFGQPKRGDVIVFVYPVDRTKDFIKRLVGLPGDEVLIREGEVFINGQPVMDRRIKNTYYYNCDGSRECKYGRTNQVVRVPQGKYFVLGDNSGSSYDSRYWGFVDQHDVIGKADLLFWPFNRVKLL